MCDSIILYNRIDIICICIQNSYSPSHISELSEDDCVMAGHRHSGERSSDGQPAGSHDY